MYGYADVLTYCDAVVVSPSCFLHSHYAHPSNLRAITLHGGIGRATELPPFMYFE